MQSQHPSQHSTQHDESWRRTFVSLRPSHNVELTMDVPKHTKHAKRLMKQSWRPTPKGQFILITIEGRLETHLCSTSSSNSLSERLSLTLGALTLHDLRPSHCGLFSGRRDHLWTLKEGQIETLAAHRHALTHSSQQRRVAERS